MAKLFATTRLWEALSQDTYTEEILAAVKAAILDGADVASKRRNLPLVVGVGNRRRYVVLHLPITPFVYALRHFDGAHVALELLRADMALQNRRRYNICDIIRSATFRSPRSAKYSITKVIFKQYPYQARAVFLLRPTTRLLRQVIKYVPDINAFNAQGNNVVTRDWCDIESSHTKVLTLMRYGFKPWTRNSLGRNTFERMAPHHYRRTSRIMYGVSEIMVLRSVRMMAPESPLCELPTDLIRLVRELLY